MTGGARDDEGAQGPLLAQAGWLKAPPLQRVLDVLTREDGGARIVGGAVRNALMGLPITDIDIATPLPPPEVMARATRAGLSVHPTGLAHGTITVVAEGQPFEVTTLRRDVETDGRHAVVAFSQSWREDAERRDFTMNALYAARDGTVYDYFDGLRDLAQRHVRFIGSPIARIREDYLRILRFFRVHAQYGDGAMDTDGLAACAELKDGMARLSAERVGRETLKLLAAKGAADAVSAMDGVSVLTALLGRRAHVQRLQRLIAIETHHRVPARATTRLAALALDDEGQAAALAARLRLSLAELAQVQNAATPHAAYDPATPESAARCWLYRVGPEAFTQGALAAWAASPAPVDDSARQERLALADRWHPPAFPIRGADVLAEGVPPGPRVGQILSDLERWWMDAGFPDDEAHLRKILRDLAAVR